MPWFRLDDSFDTHPKVLMAGNEAVGLYIRCGTYAARNLTDGFVGQEIVSLYGNDSLAATLVRVRLWHRAPRGGWTIHDFLDYNPSREQVLSKRKVRSDAGRAGGLVSGEVRSGKAKGKQNRDNGEITTGGDAFVSQSIDQQGRSNREANRSTTVEPPARPDPYIRGAGFSSAAGGAYGSPSPASRNPASRPVSEVLRPEPGHRRAPDERQAAAAAAARQALADRKPP